MNAKEAVTRMYRLLDRLDRNLQLVNKVPTAWMSDDEQDTWIAEHTELFGIAVSLINLDVFHGQFEKAEERYRMACESLDEAHEQLMERLNAHLAEKRMERSSRFVATAEEVVITLAEDLADSDDKTEKE